MLETSHVIEAGALLPYLHLVAARRDLEAHEAQTAMLAMLNGEATVAQISAFLIAVHMKGETAAELAGFARALRAMAMPVPYEAPAGETLLDTCGTGGDRLNTFNISTTVALVVAGCGVRVAKHGNRAVSSSSGSADVLEHLGVAVAVSGEQAARSLQTAGICFLFAPAFHPATKQVQTIRRELKLRTPFNLLGPLSNPAKTDSQIVGTPSLDTAARVAAALAELGLAHGYVVHGSDGLDEVSLSGPTTAFRIENGAVTEATFTPEDFEVARAPVEAIRGGTPGDNAQITLQILTGECGPRRDIVLINAALALMAARKADSIADGMRAARQSLDSGAAREKLEHLRAAR